MGFRRKLKSPKYIRWDGNDVKPPAGQVTVYYWNKGTAGTGNPEDSWVKADVYGPEGEIMLSGVLASDLENLKKIIEREFRS